MRSAARAAAKACGWGSSCYYILGGCRPSSSAGRTAPGRPITASGPAQLQDGVEGTWRGDRYLRAIHDDGTEIGVKGSGVWEIDALTAAWAVMSGIDPQRGRIVFDTALGTPGTGEHDSAGLAGRCAKIASPIWAAAAGIPRACARMGCIAMACNGWSVPRGFWPNNAGRDGEPDERPSYRETAYRLWLKISPIPHVMPGEIETYGGQPNKQAADMLTAFDPGRMIWHGYTGAAGWLFRQALEGVLGAGSSITNGSGRPNPQTSIGALQRRWNPSKCAETPIREISQLGIRPMQILNDRSGHEFRKYLGPNPSFGHYCAVAWLTVLTAVCVGLADELQKMSRRRRPIPPRGNRRSVFPPCAGTSARAGPAGKRDACTSLRKTR